MVLNIAFYTCPVLLAACMSFGACGDIRNRESLLVFAIQIQNSQVKN